MSKFMEPETALARLVEEDGATIKDRVRALRMLPHPPLLMLRRLLHRPRTNPKPLPSRLFAAAGLAYAKEVAYRKSQRAHLGPKQTQTGNALGI